MGLKLMRWRNQRGGGELHLKHVLLIERSGPEARLDGGVWNCKQIFFCKHEKYVRLCSMHTSLTSPTSQESLAAEGGDLAVVA